MSEAVSRRLVLEMKTKSKKVYVVQHSYVDAGGCDETKFIGVFATKGKAAAAVETVSQQPGFRTRKKGFHISTYPINALHWTEGFGPAPRTRSRKK